MNAFFIAFVFLCEEWTLVNGQILSSADGKSRLMRFRKKEDYTFQGQLKRATEECSYIAQTDNESNRAEAIQRIKEQLLNRKVAKFYKQREKKKYYENVERKIRKKVAYDESLKPTVQEKRKHRSRSHRFPMRDFPPRRSFLPPYGSPESFPPSPHSFPRNSPFGGDSATFSSHRIYKRSNRRKDPSFSQGTFKDHNNCFSRCVFARMELVDLLGFPQESIIHKSLTDHINNRRIRKAKLKSVFRCFDDLKKVVIDDNCIYSAKLFKCMKLDEAGSWS